MPTLVQLQYRFSPPLFKRPNTERISTKPSFRLLLCIGVPDVQKHNGMSVRTYKKEEEAKQLPHMRE